MPHAPKRFYTFYTQCESFDTPAVLCVLLCANVHRDGPHSLVLKTYKYDPGMLSICSVSSPTYFSHTLSHSFNEHSPEEQICPPWDPRHDTISVIFGWSLPRSNDTPSKEADKGSANRGSPGGTPCCPRPCFIRSQFFCLAFIRALMKTFILQSRSAARNNQVPEDAGGDTDPATDVEETTTTVTGTKRKITGSTRSAST